MIVRILSSSATFNGVIYNTDKVDRGQGELMLVRNFGSLQGLERLRPEDYRNYLKMLSARNTRVVKPQFHAAISAKGKTYDPEALTDIAVKWLEAMGYGEQPYLVVFHKDTDNHHVHVVSTRIGRDGKKVSSAFEHVHALQHLNQIMGVRPEENVARDMRRALDYSFSTTAQFMMVLESLGYALKLEEGHIEVKKFGQRLHHIPVSEVEYKAGLYVNDARRQRQLRAILEKYSSIYRTELTKAEQPLAGGRSQPVKALTSDLSRFLEAKFGLQLSFHARDNQAAYGYTVLDHANQTVWKGSDILPLKDLLSRTGQQEFNKQDAVRPEQPAEKLKPVSPETVQLYAALLKAAVRNYPDLAQGLHDLGLSITRAHDQLLFTDPSAQVQVPLGELLSDATTGDHAAVQDYAASKGFSYVPPVNIAGDIDDEQINGRNRRRRKKARTNTR
ncbi:relaxase/mobilization nuclease domain-containing protein [Mucilaginibacter sp. PAMB04274]|uniref:relaxase/mobilization nuclease domain-containing protein n=1 Tax=Mucilaginibacter sp. PAMB04274 TaxID=3138568 RepID=UPI0031F6C686